MIQAVYKEESNGSKAWSRLPRLSFVFSFWKILEEDWMKIGLAVPAFVSDTELNTSLEFLFPWSYVICSLDSVNVN